MTGTMSRRALLGASAAAAVLPAAAIARRQTAHKTVSPRMARLIADYQRLADADEADRAHGTLRAAYARHSAIYGDNPDANGMPPAEHDRFKASFALVHDAEKRHDQNFSIPRWGAASVVFAEPCATMADLLAKIKVAQQEEAVDEIAEKIVADVVSLAGEVRS
jgi:hypothetical protein